MKKRIARPQFQNLLPHSPLYSISLKFLCPSQLHEYTKLSSKMINVSLNFVTEIFFLQMCFFLKKYDNNKICCKEMKEKNESFLHLQAPWIGNNVFSEVKHSSVMAYSLLNFTGANVNITLFADTIYFTVSCRKLSLFYYTFVSSFPPTFFLLTTSDILKLLKKFFRNYRTR